MMWNEMVWNGMGWDGRDILEKRGHGEKGRH